MYTIGVRLDPETRLKLEHLARVTSRSRSAIVAEAVRNFVDAQWADLLDQAKTKQSRASNQDRDDDPGDPSGWNLIV